MGIGYLSQRERGIRTEMNSLAIHEQIGSARFQNALARRAQRMPPIWLMRQAGRYHQHYQAVRQKYSFMDLCKRPELAAEVALGPVLDFDLDAAILQIARHRRHAPRASASGSRR